MCLIMFSIISGPFGGPKEIIFQLFWLVNFSVVFSSAFQKMKKVKNMF